MLRLCFLFEWGSLVETDSTWDRGDHVHLSQSNWLTRDEQHYNITLRGLYFGSSKFWSDFDNLFIWHWDETTRETVEKLTAEGKFSRSTPLILGLGLTSSRPLQVCSLGQVVSSFRISPMRAAFGNRMCYPLLWVT